MPLEFIGSKALQKIVLSQIQFATKERKTDNWTADRGEHHYLFQGDTSKQQAILL